MPNGIVDAIDPIGDMDPAEYRTLRGGIKCGPGRTKQSHRDECDINKIVAKYVRTGEYSHIAKSVPRYGDFSQIATYQEALDQVNSAERAFMELPAAVRTRVGNRPAAFIAFLEDPSNDEEAIKLGLKVANIVPTPPEPIPVIVITGGEDPPA